MLLEWPESVDKTAEKPVHVDWKSIGVARKPEQFSFLAFLHIKQDCLPLRNQAKTDLLSHFAAEV